MVRKALKQKQEIDNAEPKVIKRRRKVKEIKRIGRPPLSIENKYHQSAYRQVLEIYQTISFLSKRLLYSKDQKSPPQNSTSFVIKDQFPELSAIFDSTSFSNLQLTQSQKLRYANKYTLTYWLRHLLDKHIISSDRVHSNQLLDLMAYWFAFQQCLSIDSFHKIQDWKMSGLFERQLFENKTVRNCEIMNMMIILAINLGCFENLSFVAEAQKMDFIEESNLRETWETQRVYDQIMESRLSVREREEQ